MRNSYNLSGSQRPLKALCIVPNMQRSSREDMLEVQDLIAVICMFLAAQLIVKCNSKMTSDPHDQTCYSTAVTVQLSRSTNMRKICCVKLLTFSHNAKDFKLIHHITKGGGSSSWWNELLGVLARRLLLWPAADGVSCRVSEKGGERLTTPHLYSSATPASLFSPYASECQFLFFMALTHNVLIVSEFPLFHVLRSSVLYFYPNFHTVVPGASETKQRSTMFEYAVEGSFQGPFSRHSLHRLYSMLVVFLVLMVAN